MKVVDGFASGHRARRADAPWRRRPAHHPVLTVDAGNTAVAEGAARDSITL